MMMADLLYYFIISLLAMTWFYASGFLVLRALRIVQPSRATATLLYLLTGMALHVIVFSVFKTHGGTLNIILLGILLTIWLAYRKENFKIAVLAVSLKMHVRELCELCLIAFLFALLKAQNVMDPAIYPYFHAGRDDMFYSNVSYFIAHFGVESFYIDWSSETGQLGIIPYHYFELWLNALISDITGLLNLAVYYFITSLLISVVLYQLVLAIAATALRQELNFRHKALAFVLVFFGNVFFGLIPDRILPDLTLGYSLYDNNKAILVFLLFALSWMAWKQQRFYIAFMVLLIVPLVNYGLMPVIVLCVPVFFILHRWILKQPEPLPYKSILISYAVYLVALVGIQKLFPNHFQGVTTLGAAELIAYYNEFAKVKTVINYVFNYTWAFVAIVLPFIVIAWPLIKNKIVQPKSGFTFLMLLFLAASLGLSAVLHFLIDTSQVFTITVNAVVHLFLFSCIPLVLFKMPDGKIYKIIVLVFLVSGIYMHAERMSRKGSRIERYSASFLDEVKHTAAKIQGQGIRYLTPDYYQSVYSINPNCNYEGFYLDFFKNDVVIHTVTADQIPDRDELHNFFNYNRDLILKSSYYLNSVAKMQPAPANREEMQLRFISSNNIDFIVCTKNAEIPAAVKAMVSEEISDPLSGEKLMLIDRKKAAELKFR